MLFHGSGTLSFFSLAGWTVTTPPGGCRLRWPAMAESEPPKGLDRRTGVHLVAARASTPSRFIRSGGQLLKAPGRRSSGKIAACQIVPPIRHSCGWGGCSGSGL